MKKIKSIAYIFPNIIYLNFKKVEYLINKALKLIVESYSNLKYLNISLLCYKRLADYIIIVQENDDKGLNTITNLCHKLEYLNIFNYIEYFEISIYNIIYSCLRLLSKKLLDHVLI